MKIEKSLWYFSWFDSIPVPYPNPILHKLSGFNDNSNEKSTYMKETLRGKPHLINSVAPKNWYDNLFNSMYFL